MFLLNNVKFFPHIQRTIGDTQYPAGWFLDAAEREKIGVVEVDDIPQPDPLIYYSTENTDGSWTSVRKTAAELEKERKDRIPTTLSPVQVRLVLNKFDLLATVEAAVAAGNRDLQIEWEFRSEFNRGNALLNSMATKLGLTEVQLDSLFAEGSLL